jgi:hypothetical protein
MSDSGATLTFDPQLRRLLLSMCRHKRINFYKRAGQIATIAWVNRACRHPSSLAKRGFNRKLNLVTPKGQGLKVIA